MRPQSIVLFDRLFLASLVIGLINGVLSFDSAVDAVASDPTFAQLAWGSGFVAVVMAISFLIPLLLWYAIAYRASNIAKWILVIMTVIGLLFIGFDDGAMVASIMTLVVTVLQLAALAMLFRSDAATWLKGDAPNDDGSAGPGGVTLR